MAASNEQEIKACCANFYQNDLVRTVMGGVFHPGGLDLTRHLGEIVGLTLADHCLDVACGQGRSAVYLAEQFGCRVSGVDYGEVNVESSRVHAAEKGMDGLTGFHQGDAEGLPFPDGEFDAVISECSFCTFHDKATAAREMARVARPRGRLGLTDMTVNSPLPDDIQHLLAWVACVTGAATPNEYVKTLRTAGWTDFVIEDQSAALLDMVADIRHRLLAIAFAVALGKVDLGGLDVKEGKRLAKRALELVEDGTVGYTLITAVKG
jgi:arsenite methyltransferase